MRGETGQTLWRFGAFELSPSRGVLWGERGEVALARKSFEVLVHLLRHRGRVVPREELLEAVWPEVVVSEAAFTSAVRDLRRALSDSASSPRYVATYRGRGLRFVHEVEELTPPVAEGPGSAWTAAAVHFERALAALARVETSRGTAAPQPRERRELLVALARARFASGATTAARAAFLDAAEVARSSGDAEVLAQAALGFVGRTDVTPGVNREGVALLEEALSALPDADTPLRAELLARLGTELYYDPADTRAAPLAADAVAMAERSGDDAVLAYALTAQHFTRQHPDVHPRERTGLGKRVLALLGEAPPSDVLAIGLGQRLIDLLELGEGDAFEQTLARHGQVARALEQPFFEWLDAMLRGTRALLSGALDEAERLASETLELGRRIESPNADGVFGAQLFGIRSEQERLVELAPALEALAARHPALPVYRAAWAAAEASGPDPIAGREALAQVLAQGLDDHPRDQNWIGTLGVLAPPVARLGTADQSARLLELLKPYAGRMIVAGSGAACFGAVDHHLGLLHAAQGHVEAAREAWDAAEALEERAHAALWVERTQRARGAS